MVAITGYMVLTLDNVGKWNIFFSLKLEFWIELKLNMNNHWMVPYNFFFVCHLEIKNGWHRRTNLKTMCKLFQNYFYLKAMNHLKVDFVGMCLKWPFAKRIVCVLIRNPIWQPLHNIVSAYVKMIFFLKDTIIEYIYRNIFN